MRKQGFRRLLSAGFLTAGLVGAGVVVGTPKSEAHTCVGVYLYWPTSTTVVHVPPSAPNKCVTHNDPNGHSCFGGPLGVGEATVCFWEE